MNAKRRILVSGLAAIATVGGVIAVMPTAAATSIKRCNTTVDSRPVVLPVHGFMGNPSVWSEASASGSMTTSIKVVKGVKQVDAFDYKAYNTKWVTDRHIGQALAAQINCLAKASKEAGGNGKVIVVAHSMGGLALREALNQRATVHTSPSKIALAIMIGTPHLGTPVANWCKPGVCSTVLPAASAMRPGSPQLRALPRMPSTVPLRVIVGRITNSKGVGNNDGIVPVKSASDEYTTKYAGDGSFEQTCLLVRITQKPSCHHENLLKDAGVQARVIQALNEYVKSLPKPVTPSPTLSSASPTSPAPASSPVETPTPSATCTSASPSPTESEGDGVGTGMMPSPASSVCP